jgi:hypothetical protein
LEKFALGVLRMTEADFYNTTPRTYLNIVEGYNSEYRRGMELHRETIISLLMPHLAEADRKKPMAKLYPLPWDANPKKSAKPEQNPVDFWAAIDAKTKKE